MSTYSPEWLDLREPADAAARAAQLLEPLRLGGEVVIRDLGCGTGSLGRWLAPRLPGEQHWILTDHDVALLARAVLPSVSADGGAVHVATEARDVTALRATDLAGTSLVTASALLDLLTRAEVSALVAAIAEAGCAALLTLSVVGRVELWPPDPLDEQVATAFNAHQRRDGLLGPVALDATAAEFSAWGYRVFRAASPWRLGPESAELQREWLEGWVGAASEQNPGLRAEDYLRRRLDQASAGGLHAVIHHGDLLALPPDEEVAA